MIDTNLKGPLYITRLVLPYMIECNEGYIVNIGSVGGRWVSMPDEIYWAALPQMQVAE
jgi:3-hydroxy acid dehydrogenase / malonic semialdehyde reductase